MKSDDVKENITEKKEREEGGLALMKETVSESAEDNASMDTKEDSS